MMWKNLSSLLFLITFWSEQGVSQNVTLGGMVRLELHTFLICPSNFLDSNNHKVGNEEKFSKTSSFATRKY